MQMKNLQSNKDDIIHS